MHGCLAAGLVDKSLIVHANLSASWPFHTRHAWTARLLPMHASMSLLVLAAASARRGPIAVRASLPAAAASPRREQRAYTCNVLQRPAMTSSPVLPRGQRHCLDSARASAGEDCSSSRSSPSAAPAPFSSAARLPLRRSSSVVHVRSRSVSSSRILLRGCRKYLAGTPAGVGATARACRCQAAKQEGQGARTLCRQTGRCGCRPAARTAPWR